MPFRDGAGPRREHGRGMRRGMGQGRRVGLSRKGSSTQTATVAIDAEKCVGCGDCVSACPTDALSLVDGKAKLDRVRCKGCRVCVDVCPTGAIT